MKLIFTIIAAAILTASCSLIEKSGTKSLKVTVINKATDSPVDSAKLMLVAIHDARDVSQEVKYTDKSGHCRFSISTDPLTQYQIHSEKKGFIGYYDASATVPDRSNTVIDPKSSTNVLLYLTTDTMNQYNYWLSHSTRFAMDTLIQMLITNTYPLRSEFPLLSWDDIPILLAIGNNTTPINKYPENLISSFLHDDRYVGIIALWFIESIRITEMKHTMNPMEKFPSLHPSLTLIVEGTPQTTPNTPEIMDKAFQAYSKWWDKVKSMEKQKACRLNPLEGSNLKW